MSHVLVTPLPTADETASPAPVERLDQSEPDGAMSRLWRLVPTGAVLVACAWWLLIAPRLFGGRGAGAITGGALATAVATLLVAPQRVLPLRAVWLAVWVSVAALAVSLAAPTGWAGVGTAATYVGMSWTVIAVAAAVVRDRRCASVITLTVVAGVLIEVAESWLAWWGGMDAATPIIGTFYWYNQFAIFLVAGGVIGFALWLQHSRLVAAFGLVACALSTIGVVYSTSRASAAVFATALVLVAAGSVVALRGRAAVRLLVATAVIGVCVWGIGGPPFFPHRSLPFASTAARASGQSLGQNGGYRVDFWREAIGVFTRHPLVGGGYHSMIAESVGHTPRTWPLSPFAHNGFLQAMSDGGLVLAVPFLLACLAMLWLVVAALARAVRRRDFSVQTFVVPLCLGALLAHSAVDFDWSYAGDFAVAAVLAGLVAGEHWARRRSRVTTPRLQRATAVAVLVGVVLTGVAGIAAHAGDMKERLPVVGAQR